MATPLRVWLANDDRRVLADDVASLQLAEYRAHAFGTLEELLGKAESRRTTKPDVILLPPTSAGVRLALDLRRYASLSKTVIAIYGIIEAPEEQFFALLADAPVVARSDVSVTEIVTQLHRQGSSPAAQPRDLVIRLPALLSTLALLMSRSDEESLLALFHSVMISYLAQHPEHLRRALSVSSSETALSDQACRQLNNLLEQVDLERLRAIAEREMEPLKI